MLFTMLLKWFWKALPESSPDAVPLGAMPCPEVCRTSKLALFILQCVSLTALMPWSSVAVTT